VNEDWIVHSVSLFQGVVSNIIYEKIKELKKKKKKGERELITSDAES